MKNFIDYFRLDNTVLNNRRLMLGAFAYQKDRPVYPDKPSTPGGIVFAKKPTSIDKSLYGYYDGETFHELVPSEHNPAAPFSIADVIQISSGDVVNFKGGTLKTTIGHFITNKLVLSDSVGDKIPYVNGLFKIKDIEHELGRLLLAGEISVQQHLDYVENGTELGHMGELFVPTMSEKSVSVPKYILDRRDALLKEHKDDLGDAKVVAAIEKELVDMYKEYMGDDPATGFLEANRKSYNDHIKTMHIMVGGVTNFGGNADDVAVINKSLSEGWDKRNFPAMANSIRRGSYSRGVETQNGGALTKLIFRAFQDVKLFKGDCGSRKGATIKFDNVVTPNMFFGRTIITGDGRVLLTEKNASKYEGKTVKMRTPLFCKQKGGICMTCMGDTFRKLEIDHPGTLAISVTSAMMSSSMSAMHVDSIDVRPIEFDDYIV